MQITLGTQFNMGILYRNTNTTGKKIKYNGGLLPDIMLSTPFSSDCRVNWTQVAPS